MDAELLRAAAVLRNRGLVAPPPHTMTLAEARSAYDDVGRYLTALEVPLANESSLSIRGPHGPIPCHVYRPDRLVPCPALIYFHGGGFCMGEAAGWHGLMRQLVRAAGVCAFNVEYRLAPEHRFPAAFEDAVAAVQFVTRHAARHGIQGKHVAVGGDSAGANLALAAACALRDAGTSPLAMLLLFYGVYSPDTTADSWLKLGGGEYGLSRQTMEWAWNTYLADDVQRNDWRAAPSRASLRDLPYVYMNVGTLDPLQEDASRLSAKLQQSGVEHQLAVYSGANHGFIRLGSLAGIARQAVADAARVLRERLAV